MRTRALSGWTRLYVGLVAFSLAGSLLTRVLHLEAGMIAGVTSVLTLLAGCAGIFATAQGRSVGKTIAVVLLLGVMAELVGLYTGYPFGRYAYTDRWWPTVVLPGSQRFPLLLPVAWLLVTAASYFSVARIAATGWGAILCGALLAALVDLVMEPVMTSTLRYWKWLDPGPLPGGAPVLNFVGWLIVSIGACFVLDKGIRLGSQSNDAPWVLGGHVALTLGIAAISTVGS